jgi:hypothetical protein
MARHRRGGKDADMVARCHDMQLLLCDELEALADSLPSGVGRQRCLHLARAIYPLVASSHEIEEALLFDPLSSFDGSMPNMPLTLERLRYEHHFDLCFAEELNDMLLAFGRGEDLMTADAVGYMLRAFFETVRRHVAFEKEILVPLLELIDPIRQHSSCGVRESGTST